MISKFYKHIFQCNNFIGNNGLKLAKFCFTLNKNDFKIYFSWS